MEDKGELLPIGPRDLAATLRKQYPELPEIWEGGPSKNPAAKALAYRIQQDYKKGIDVSVFKLEWFHVYSKAMVRRRTTIIEEEEFSFEDDRNNQDALIQYLLESIAKAKKETTERSDNLHRFYQDLLDKKDSRFMTYVEKQEQRRDDHISATIELFAKDKDKNLDLVAKVYKGNSDAQQRVIDSATSQQAQLFKDVTSILSSSHDLTKKYFDALKEVIEKLEGKLLEDFIRMVIFPLTPTLIPLIFKVAKIPVPEGLVEGIVSGIQKAMAVDGA